MTLDEECQNAAGSLMAAWFHHCKGQVQPDGKNCTICEDTDHQAFECQFNPFVRFAKSLDGLELQRYFPRYHHIKGP